jgi:acetyltransferase-like isoleucine patch superfamily enzyme
MLFLRQLQQILRRLLSRASGVLITADTRLGAGIVLRRGYRSNRSGSVVIGPGCTLDTGAVLDAWGGSLRLGSRVFVGPYAVIYGQGGVEIGDDCLIAMHCRILSSEHAQPPVGVIMRSQPDILKATRLGNDVWLGAGVTVLGGVTLGDGCIIGAGAVVTHDIPAGAIALGIPARVVGRRPESTAL